MPPSGRQHPRTQVRCNLCCSRDGRNSRSINQRTENPRVRSVHTKQRMKISVHNFEKFLGRAGAIADLSPANLISFAKDQESLGMSPRTIEREQVKMRTLWGWASSSGWCEKDSQIPRNAFIPPWRRSDGVAGARIRRNDTLILLRSKIRARRASS
jgi:hypothetical protein